MHAAKIIVVFLSLLGLSCGKKSSNPFPAVPFSNELANRLNYHKTTIDGLSYQLWTESQFYSHLRSIVLTLQIDSAKSDCFPIRIDLKGHTIGLTQTLLLKLSDMSQRGKDDMFSKAIEINFDKHGEEEWPFGEHRISVKFTLNNGKTIEHDDLYLQVIRIK